MKKFLMQAFKTVNEDERAAAPVALTLGRGGVITSSDVERPISQIPAVRMAGGSGWDEVFRALRAQEDGEDSVMVVQPGGTIVRHDPQGGDAQPVSVIPKVRMAASLVDEAMELAALDPDRVENWQHVQSSNGEVEGWRFQLHAPFHQRPFSFLTFRNPSRGNGWEISPLWPDLDDQFGHGAHMISTQMGGQTVPMLCGPGGRPARDLTEVRGIAAKWTAYTSARMTGRNPGFSL